MTNQTDTVSFQGVSATELARVLSDGVDHGGNPVEAFVDPAGGWPLRCCLAPSRPGDRIAVIAWSPFDWRGPYRETGPVVVHTEGCTTVGDLTQLPDPLDSAPMTLRPYRPDRTIAYEHVRHVPAGRSLTAEVRDLLLVDGVAMVHGRNVTGGCFAFAAHAGPGSPRSW
jgi:hypothetical protein